MRGITSPARSITTVSPTRTSRRSISSALCSVARLMVAPAMRTGSRRAAGVSAPVRPTLMSMATIRVVRLLGGELVRDGPSRVVGRRAELPLLDEAIDLHDDAVGVVARGDLRSASSL